MVTGLARQAGVGVLGQRGQPEHSGQVLGSGQCSAANPPGLWNKLVQGAGCDPAAPTATSGWHFDAKVLAKLFQKHKREHGVGHEADTSRHEALREKGGEHEDSPRGTPPPPYTPPHTPLPCLPTPNLVKGQRPQLRCLHGAVQNTLQTNAK